MQLFVDGYGIELLVDTGIDLTGADEVKILYKKPNNQHGEWVGEVNDTTKIKYILAPGDVDVHGIWYIQSYAKFSDSELYGEKVPVEVLEHL